MNYSRQEVYEMFTNYLATVVKDKDLLRAFRQVSARFNFGTNKPEHIYEYVTCEEAESVASEIRFSVPVFGDFPYFIDWIPRDWVVSCTESARAWSIIPKDHALANLFLPRFIHFVSNLSVELQMVLSYSPELRSYDSEENYIDYIFSVFFDIDQTLSTCESDEEFFQKFFNAKYYRPAFFVYNDMKKIGCYTGLTTGTFINPVDTVSSSRPAKQVGFDGDIVEQFMCPIHNLLDYHSN